MIPSQCLACGPEPSVLLLRLQLVPCQLQGGPVSLSGSSTPTSPARCSPAFLHSQLPSRCLRAACPALLQFPIDWGPFYLEVAGSCPVRAASSIQTKHLQGSVSEPRKPDLRNRVSVPCHMVANFSLLFSAPAGIQSLTWRSEAARRRKTVREIQLWYAGIFPLDVGEAVSHLCYKCDQTATQTKSPQPKLGTFTTPHIQWQVFVFHPSSPIFFTGWISRTDTG